MTMTDVRTETEAPVSFRRAVLVGIDDPMLDGAAVPPVPAAPLTVADIVAPASALPSDGVLPRTRLATAVGSVALLVLAVAGMAWLRFGDARNIPGSQGPVPTVAISVPAPALAEGATVLVDVGPGAGVERVD